jgi:hypothetical protein
VVSDSAYLFPALPFAGASLAAQWEPHATRLLQAASAAYQVAENAGSTEALCPVCG